MRRLSIPALVLVLISLLIFPLSAQTQGTSYSLFRADEYPTDVSSNSNPIEVGMKFGSVENGAINAIRFYKGNSIDHGPHVGHLWTADGSMLAEVTFTSETDTGWQTATLNTPVAITANTTYVVSVYKPDGTFYYTRPYFSSRIDRSPLYAPSDAESGGNGLYLDGASGFPNASYMAANYWVDVVFVEGGQVQPTNTPTNTPVLPTVTETVPPVVTQTVTPTVTPTVTQTVMQTVTPTLPPPPTSIPAATGTPGYWEAVQISSGDLVIVERRITYGEIAIVIFILFLSAILLVIAFLVVPRLWP